MRSLRKNEKALRAVQPNAGIAAAYRAKIMRLVREMAASYLYWLRAAYRGNPPKMAQDELPSRELERVLKSLGIRWQKRFETAAPELAAYFAKTASKQSEAALRRILRDAGVTVKFKLTPELRDILKATITENVGLIRSIASEYHTEVEGLVMRSVSAGRDLSKLTQQLQARYGVTERRAKLIALDQNNKATSVIQRERQTALGLELGIWMHSHAGKEPRPTHLANDGKRFSISEGWFDPDPRVRERIWPGQLIRCRCTWKVLVKGFS